MKTGPTQQGIAQEAPPQGGQDTGYYRRLQAAVEELLVLKGLVTREAIDREVAAMQSRGHERGAAVVARAWVDPQFKAQLLADGSGAVRSLGFEIGPMHLLVVENTAQVHNVIVCTLCSCYPRMLLGMPPDWYKSTEYRSRVVREPRQVLKEFGLALDPGVSVRVHDSTADMRYMVLPMRPAGTEGWSEAALAGLVSGNALVGVDIVRRPATAAAG
jgi:nitrile hydratase